MPKITAFLPEYFLNKLRRGHARTAALILRYPPLFVRRCNRDSFDSISLRSE